MRQGKVSQQRQLGHVRDAEERSAGLRLAPTPRGATQKKTRKKSKRQSQYKAKIRFTWEPQSVTVQSNSWQTRHQRTCIGSMMRFPLFLVRCKTWFGQIKFFWILVILVHGFTAVKNTVCLSLLELCPPAVNPEFVMECKLTAHPIR